jgi:transcriptional regulator with XRE-family HTH domain
MRTLTDIATALDTRRAQARVGKLKLADEAGITYRTLSNVLSGAQDFKVSTLLALADRLGLEVLVVPKAAAPALVASPAPAAQVQSRVQAALAQLRDEEA